MTGIAIGVVAGVVALVLLTQIVLPGELATLRGLSRLSAQLGGAGDNTTGARVAAVIVGGLATAAVVGRYA